MSLIENKVNQDMANSHQLQQQRQSQTQRQQPTQQPQQRISPRKFIEKIALLNQKEAEGTAAFNQILNEVKATTTRPSPYQQHHHHQGIKPIGINTTVSNQIHQNHHHNQHQQQQQHQHTGFLNIQPMQVSTCRSLPNVNQCLKDSGTGTISSAEHDNNLCYAIHQDHHHHHHQGTTNELSQQQSFYNMPTVIRSPGLSTPNHTIATHSQYQQHQQIQRDNSANFNNATCGGDAPELYAGDQASGPSPFDDNNIINEQLVFGGLITDTNATADDNNDNNDNNYDLTNSNSSTIKKTNDAISNNNEIFDSTIQSILEMNELDGHLAPPITDKWRRSSSDSALNNSCVSSSGTSPVEHQLPLYKDSCSDNQDNNLPDQHDLPELPSTYLQEMQITQTDHNDSSPQNTNDLFSNYNQQANYLSGDDSNQELLTTNENCNSNYVNSDSYQSFNRDYNSTQHQNCSNQCMPLPKSIPYSKQNYLLTTQQTHLRPKSCEVPGINICTIDDDNSNSSSMMQISTSNTGSLPNLPNLFHSTPIESSFGSKSGTFSSANFVSTKCPKGSPSQHDQGRSQIFYSNTENNNLPIEQPAQQLHVVTAAPIANAQLNQNLTYDNTSLEQPHQPLLRSSSMSNKSQKAFYANSNENYNFKSGYNKLNNEYNAVNHNIMNSIGLNQIPRSSSHNNLSYRYQQPPSQHPQQIQSIQDQSTTNRQFNQTTFTYQDPSCDRTVQNVQYNI